MKTPLLTAFSLYISSNKSLEAVASETGEDVEAIKTVAKQQNWTEMRKAVNAKARQVVARDVTGDKIGQIRRLQEKERRTIEKRLKTLEAALDALDPLAEKETERLTVAKLKTYAETAAIFQRMLYKSYGIEDTRQPGDDDGIFAAVRPGEVITRYRIDRVERAGTTPPPTGKTGRPADPHLTPTDITHIEKAVPFDAAKESVAEVVEEEADTTTRRRRGKLSGYGLTDVFDNITKEARDEEGRDGAKRGEEGGGGPEETGGRGGEEADEGAAGDAEAAQAEVVDERLGMADGPSGNDRSEVGEDTDVEGAARVGDGAADGGPEADQGVAEEGLAGSGVPRSCGGEPCEESFEEGLGEAGDCSGDAPADVSGLLREESGEPYRD